MQDEITKHTKKIVAAVKSEDHGFLAKLREVVTEIVIIVFAVTLSIWLHSWSEHRHEQAEVREFLRGLSDDIASDIAHYQKDSASFRQTKKDIAFAGSLTKTRVDSLRKVKNFTLNYNLPPYWCIFSDGRYEGFKSSGKIGQIENVSLKDNILNYYQRTIPEIHRAEEEFKNSGKQITNLILTQDEKASIGDLLVTKKMKVVYRLSDYYLDWMIHNNEEARKQAKEIQAEIKKTLAE